MFNVASLPYKVLLMMLLIGSWGYGYAQSEMPEYGKIADLKGKSKVYVIATAEHRKLILRELGKRQQIVNVDRAEDAEFFVEYKTLSREEPIGIVRGTGVSMPYENGQLDVFFLRDNKKVIAWSEARNVGWYKGLPSNVLTKEFLKELSKKPK